MSCSTNATPCFRKLTIDYNEQAQKDDHVVKIHVYLLLLSAISCLLVLSIAFSFIQCFNDFYEFEWDTHSQRFNAKINNEWDHVFLGLS